MVAGVGFEPTRFRTEVYALRACLLHHPAPWFIFGAPGWIWTTRAVSAPDLQSGPLPVTVYRRTQMIYFRFRRSFIIIFSSHICYGGSCENRTRFMRLKISYPTNRRRSRRTRILLLMRQMLHAIELRPPYSVYLCLLSCLFFLYFWFFLYFRLLSLRYIFLCLLWCA